MLEDEDADVSFAMRYLRSRVQRTKLVVANLLRPYKFYRPSEICKRGNGGSVCCVKLDSAYSTLLLEKY